MTKGSLTCSGPQSKEALNEQSPGGSNGTSQDSPSILLNTKDDNQSKCNSGCSQNLENNNCPVDVNQNSVSEINNNTNEINIAEYVQNLPEYVRNKIAGIFRNGVNDQSVIDIENIEHYLIVSRCSNSLKAACESKLLSSLTAENCLQYLHFAEQFDLGNLRNNAWLVYENNCAQCVTEKGPDKKYSEQLQSRQNYTHRKYNAIFTCDTLSNKRTISVVVLDSQMSVRCHKVLKKGDKISKQFQCCCLQDDEQHAPYVFWSFGSTVCRYDPILNKCKKRESLRFCRSKFALLSCGQFLYAVGGECNGKTVRQIEQYNLKRKSWKVISQLPVECNMTYSSCVVDGDLIYILSGATSKENCCQNRTVVCTLNTVSKTIQMLPEIPMSFEQIKSCVYGDHIYLASDSREFIRYTPSDGNFVRIKDQSMKCKDFGMFVENDAIFLIGGINKDGKCNNYIRKYSIKTGYWERLSECLPDPMSVYGICDIKIPNSCSIIPFYETNLFEIHPRNV